MYEIAMAHGLIDIISSSKPHKVVAATEDGKQVPFSVLQVSYRSIYRTGNDCIRNLLARVHIRGINSYWIIGNLRSVYVLFASL